MNDVHMNDPVYKELIDNRSPEFFLRLLRFLSYRTSPWALSVSGVPPSDQMLRRSTG